MIVSAVEAHRVLFESGWRQRQRRDEATLASSRRCLGDVGDTLTRTRGCGVGSAMAATWINAYPRHVKVLTTTPGMANAGIIPGDAVQGFEEVDDERSA